MKKQQFSKKIWTIIGILIILIIHILLLLFSPILWIKYRLLPYKKRLIEIELMIRVIDISLTAQSALEGLLGNKNIYRTGETEKKLPSVFYISKKDFAKFAEHITIDGDKTVLASLELSYWKYGFGKSRLVSYKLLDKKPKVRK